MAKVDLSQHELNFVKDILRNFPATLIFGSRVKGASTKYSDLDICLKDPISDYQYVLLEEAFSESDLPFKVDLVEYARVSDAFKKRIDAEGIKLALLK